MAWQMAVSVGSLAGVCDGCSVGQSTLIQIKLAWILLPADEETVCCFSTFVPQDQVCDSGEQNSKLATSVWAGASEVCALFEDVKPKCFLWSTRGNLS